MKYIKLILLVFSLLLLPWAGNEAWAKEAEITDLRWTARNDGDPPLRPYRDRSHESGTGGGCDRQIRQKL